MATTECRYQYFCNEITTILDGPDILPKISSYERVIVESLNLNHPFEDRWACVLCFIIFFPMCAISVSNSLSQPVVILTVKTLLYFPYTLNIGSIFTYLPSETISELL